ncbi:hypothetical protein MSPP1_003462, partial [Malassezia sp. CBS 17886]
MSPSFIFGLATSLLVCAISASALVTRSEDSFYTPPAGWKDKKPGEILRWRSFQPKFTYVPYRVQEAYQVLYRTIGNTTAQPSHTVTTILVPYGSKKDVLVLGSEAQDSNAQKCAPSVGYMTGSAESLGFQLDETLFLPYMEAGYVLTVPDHEGPLNAFTAGRMEGHMTLDAIRATLAFKKLKLAKDPKIVGYGYSGGGLNLGWASSMQPKYAPELNITAWAFGGTPSNLSATVEHASGQLLSGFLAAGVTGIVDAYPAVKEYVNTILTDAGREALDFCRHNCLDAIVIRYAFQALNTFKYTKNGPDAFKARVVQDAFRELTMGLVENEYPTAPTFMYHASNDEVVSYPAAVKTARDWCDMGAQLHFTTYTDSSVDHLVAELIGGVTAFQFLQDRLAGKSMAQGCKFDSSATAQVEPDVLGGTFTSILKQILTIFGKKIGPGGSTL